MFKYTHNNDDRERRVIWQSSPSETPAQSGGNENVAEPVDIEGDTEVVTEAGENVNGTNEIMERAIEAVQQTEKEVRAQFDGYARSILKNANIAFNTNVESGDMTADTVLAQLNNDPRFNSTGATFTLNAAGNGVEFATLPNANPEAASEQVDTFGWDDIMKAIEDLAKILGQLADAFKRGWNSGQGKTEVYEEGQEEPSTVENAETGNKDVKNMTATEIEKEVTNLDTRIKKFEETTDTEESSKEDKENTKEEKTSSEKKDAQERKAELEGELKRRKDLITDEWNSASSGKNNLLATNVALEGDKIVIEFREGVTEDKRNEIKEALSGSDLTFENNGLTVMPNFFDEADDSEGKKARDLLMETFAKPFNEDEGKK